MTEVVDRLGRFVEELLGALAAGDGEGVRAHLAPGAWERGFRHLAGDVERLGARVEGTGERWALAGRAAVGIEVITSRARRRQRMLVEEEEGAWRVVDVTSDRAIVWAFLVRWLDGGTRFEDLPASLAGASWGTALAGGLLGGARPGELLGAERVDAASDEIREAAVRHLTEALAHAPRRGADVAVLGARELPATGQVAVGVTVLGDDREHPVWLTLKPPGPDGARWRLLDAGTWPSLSALVEGEALERSVAGALGRPTSPLASDAVAAAIDRAGRRDDTSPEVATLIRRLRATLERPQGLAEGVEVGRVGEGLRALVAEVGGGEETPAIDAAWLERHGPALVARVLALLASQSGSGT